MDREIGVALPVAELGICEAAVGRARRRRACVLPRGQRPERLGEQRRPPATRTVTSPVLVRNSVPLTRRDRRDRAARSAPSARRARRAGSRAGSGPMRSSRWPKIVLPLRAPGAATRPATATARALLSHLVPVERERLGGGVGALEPVGIGRHAPRLDRRPVLPPGRLDVRRSSTVVTPPCLRTASR